MTSDHGNPSISVKQRILAYVKIIRVPNDVAIGIAVIVAMLISRVQEIAPMWFIILAGITGFLVSAHGMVVNDIIDYNIDMINAPTRPLPSHEISRKHAIIFAWVLAVLSMGLALSLDWLGFARYPLSWLYAFIHLLLLDAYNKWLKRRGLIGNIVVAYSVAAVLLYADIFYNGRFTLLPSTIALIGFTSNLGREITKGIIDVEGDRVHGVKTIAVLFGVHAAQGTAISLYILSLCEVAIILFWGDMGIIGILGAVSFIIALLCAMYWLLRGANALNAKKTKGFILYGFIVALTLFLIDVFI